MPCGAGRACATLDVAVARHRPRCASLCVSLVVLLVMMVVFSELMGCFYCIMTDTNRVAFSNFQCPLTNEYLSFCYELVR